MYYRGSNCFYQMNKLTPPQCYLLEAQIIRRGGVCLTSKWSQEHGGLMVLLLMTVFRLSLTETYSLHQLISDPTHILSISSSCIDLIFTDQPNLVVDSGVHPSLHPNCHHQITYCKFNLFIEYPPPYEQQVWDYKHADTSSIKKSLNQVN